MFATCGKPKLNESTLRHLRSLGQALHSGHQPLVFDGGFCGLVEQRGSEVNASEESEPGSRPETGSRQGRRTSRRRRPSGQAQPFRSRAIEDAHGVGFRLLAQHYEALGFEDKNGLWVTVTTKPLGQGGPQAHLLVAAPTNLSIFPRAWAFSAIGRNAQLFPLKHTNFPDASMCAFTKESGAWVPEDGLLALIDHYSLWIIKSWHRSVEGWWPGRQVGACALYRRTEFTPDEFCGCESGRLYGLCHERADMQMPEATARQEFQRLFSVAYEDRDAPAQIVASARNRWKSMPDMASAYARRFDHTEPCLPL